MTNIRNLSDGIEAMPRGEVQMVVGSPYFSEGTVFEVQLDGVAQGFEPSYEETHSAYHVARKQDDMIGGDIFSVIYKRTGREHRDLVKEGLADLQNDPNIDSLRFSMIDKVRAILVSNRRIGRKNG